MHPISRDHYHGQCCQSFVCRQPTNAPFSGTPRDSSRQDNSGQLASSQPSPSSNGKKQPISYRLSFAQTQLLLFNTARCVRFAFQDSTRMRRGLWICCRRRKCSNPMINRASEPKVIRGTCGAKVPMPQVPHRGLLAPSISRTHQCKHDCCASIRGR